MADFCIWSNLLASLRQSASYLKAHARLSTRLTSALYSIVCLIVTQSLSVLYTILDSTSVVFQCAGLHILCLGACILLVCLFKSLRPKYRFLNGHGCGRKRDYQQLLGCQFHELQPSNDPQISSSGIDKGVASKEALFRLLIFLGARQQAASKACFNAVTDGNIQSIFKQLSWSSTRPEFESVYWLNHTLQTLWPAGRTLTRKLIVNALTKAKSSASNEPPRRTQQLRPKNQKQKQVKLKLIKSEGTQKRALKLIDFLSCRRQLELLHKNKRRVMSKSDEHLIRKSVMMVVYLAKKFILCFKQYLIDQLYWLMVNLPSGKSHSLKRAQGERRPIEVDLEGLISTRNFKFKPGKRRTKSASEPIGTPARQYASRIRFRSAPETGLACNSRRIISGRQLISFDGMKSLRNRREKLVRSINEMVRESLDEIGSGSGKNRKRITVKRFDLGEKAPEITAIKFLERDDDILAETLIGSSLISPDADSNTMHLLVELSFESGGEFQIWLSSVPLLGELRLSRFDVRLRLLVAMNHAAFDVDENLDVRRALDSNQLLPIFNQIQVALVDLPQLNWRIKRARANHVGERRSANRIVRRKTPKSRTGNTLASFSNLARTPMRAISRHLELPRLINNNYFKYLVHCALHWVQRWFEPFDIMIGQKLYLKTLW